MNDIFILDNGILRAEISPHGGELCAVYKDGCNYIWHADPLFWSNHSLNLFPYIARLTNETYTLNGKQYNMGIHGFIKDKVLPIEEYNAGKAISFMLESDSETLEHYPFEFLYRVRYDISGAALDVTYTVENRSGSAMYFGIGGHPGFNVPLEPGMNFEDYYIEFDAPCCPGRVLFSERYFVTGTVPYPLIGDRFIPLTHGLFDDDVITLANMAKTVSLKSKKGTRSVTVEYPDFDYLGIWHTPCTEAPFVCIEPWSSLPSRDGVVEELTAQRDLIKLPEGETYKNVWRITFD